MEALIVDRDEALGLARELAERRGASFGEAVVASLRAALHETLPTDRPSPRSLRVPSLEELTRTRAPITRRRGPWYGKP